MVYIVAFDHGFILAFMLGFMSLMLQAAPCEPASASVVESREPATASRLIGTILGHFAGGVAAPPGPPKIQNLYQKVVAYILLKSGLGSATDLNVVR